METSPLTGSIRRLQQHTTGGWPINNGNEFHTVPEAGPSKVKAPANQLSGEDPIPGSQKSVFLHGPQVRERARELSAVSLIRALMPFMRAPLP